jgi:hypothetical protein
MTTTPNGHDEIVGTLTARIPKKYGGGKSIIQMVYVEPGKHRWVCVGNPEFTGMLNMLFGPRTGIHPDSFGYPYWFDLLAFLKPANIISQQPPPRSPATPMPGIVY